MIKFSITKAQKSKKTEKGTEKNYKRIRRIRIKTRSTTRKQQQSQYIAKKTSPLNALFIILTTHSHLLRQRENLFSNLEGWNHELRFFNPIKNSTTFSISFATGSLKNHDPCFAAPIRFSY